MSFDVVEFQFVINDFMVRRFEFTFAATISPL